MTSQIDAKRKELEKQAEYFNKMGVHFAESYVDEQLRCFNLGVSLAQKEFLEWLEHYYYYNEVFTACDCEGCQDIRNKIRELKQSLGEKT